MRRTLVVVGTLALAAVTGQGTAGVDGPTEADKAWLLPAAPPAPDDNRMTPERVKLGKMLFFDPRLSRDGNMSCATCHSPLFGWSDSLPTAKGFKGATLPRATPTIVNTGYNSIQMWDGRKKTLEDQAMGPMESNAEMNMDLGLLFTWMNENEGYRAAFAKAYAGEPIDAKTLSKAIAAYERTIVSNNSPFDRWLHGESNAMTPQQVRGFRLFTDPDKGHCAVCHSAPNFTDNGFHNLGLRSFGVDEPDLGRYLIKPVKTMRGAFKTPTLRDVALTAPYFHDGSAKTLMDAVNHYEQGGEVKTNLSPNMKPLRLTQQEKDDLVVFMEALTSPQPVVTLPALPR